MKLRLLLLILCCSTATLHAQQLDRNEFSDILAHVSKLGPMRDSSMRQIVAAVIKPCHSQAAVAYALYCWEALNVAYDCDAYHHPRRRNNSASVTLQDRLGVAEGYAELYRQLCGIAHLSCTNVTGWARRFPKAIGKMPDAERHTWNQIEASGRHYLVDACWGAGTTDEKIKEFSKAFTDAWFAPNRQQFAFTHYPDDKQNQLLDTPVAKSVYTQAPVISAFPFVIGAGLLPATRGTLRGRADSTIRLNLTLQQPEKLLRVTLRLDPDDKDTIAKFTITGHEAAVYLPVVDEGEYPAYIYINGFPAYAFNIQASKGKKKKPIVTPPAPHSKAQAPKKKGAPSPSSTN